MKKYLLLICFLSFSIQGIAQTPDSLFTKALERYPMLKEYTIPDFPEKVLYGTLEVYENHVAKEGKKIPIDVVVLPAKTANPATSAFTLHWGGNGDAAKNKIWGFRSESTSGRIRATRDIVLIDDRGTGASNIRCAAMDSLQPYSYAFVYDNEVILECLKEVKDKVNLELYNTPAVVRDYDLVREWLGLEQLDFFGISYGVRVGLEYMRTYPENLRTLTVQGCVPPGFDYVNEMDKAIQEQLDILIQRCKEDTTCNQYYPNFKEELYEIRDRLAEEPFQFEYDLGNGRSKAITIDDLLFRRIVGHQILHGDAYELMPLYIHWAYEGNYAPLITAGGSLTLDMPVFLSLFCPEEIDRFDYSPIHADLFTQGAIAEEKKLACSLWAEMPTADWLNEPLKGNCPILILTGEYDANTPIRMGEQIRNAFTDASRHIILPYQGHASSEVSCRYDMIAQFVESKNLSTIDTTCLSSIQPGAFLFELNLSNKEFEKYVGNYTAEDPEKVLELYKQNDVYYLRDEFSQWTGPTQLLYKGNHTFDVMDCPGCQLVFEMLEDKPVQVKRVYRETTVFEPEKQSIIYMLLVPDHQKKHMQKTTMRILFLLLMIISNVLIIKAQDVKAFYVGHSLSDQIPDMVKSLADDHMNVDFDWAYQGIPGAPLRWQWERKDADDYVANPPFYYGFYDEDGGLPVGDFDVMVLTEAVPRYGALIEETYEYADSFFVYANLYNPQIKVYLYEDWHCILSGTPTQCDYDIDSNPWRQRIEDDLPMWESVVDTLNARFNPTNPVCLIPAAQGLAQVYDSIYAGVMPGLTTIEDIFSDNIHLNDVGKYFVACVHFSTIFETSPVGLTNQLQVWWGGDFEAPSPALALKFQEIAWDVSVGYQNSCISSIVSTDEPVAGNNELSIFPNPANDVIFVRNGTETPSSANLIYNIYGELIQSSERNEINVSSLPSGIYFLVHENSMIKFIKQ